MVQVLSRSGKFNILKQFDEDDITNLITDIEYMLDNFDITNKRKKQIRHTVLNLVNGKHNRINCKKIRL